MCYLSINKLELTLTCILIATATLMLSHISVEAADATAYGWKFSGLRKEIRSLAFSVDEQTVYAGTRSGLHQSQDGGQSWVQIFPNSSAEVRTIAVAKDTPGRLYVGVLTTENIGLFTSADSGQSWTEIDTGLGINFPMDIELHPNDDRIIYVGTGWGVIKSEDAGGTWRSISKGLEGETGDLPWVHRIAIDPVNPETIYILTNNFQIHIPPRINAAPVYQGIPDRSTAQHNVKPGIYKTSDAGLTWERLQSNIDFAPTPTDLEIMPADTQVFYVSTALGVYKTEDRGTTFQLVLGDLLRYPGTRSLAIDPTDGSIYAGLSSVGVYLSSTHGQTWQQIFNHAPGSRGEASSYAILISQNQDRKIYSGFTRGVFYKVLNQNQNQIDFDDNGMIEFQDFLLFAQHFGSSVDTMSIETRFDLNEDGQIDFRDFIILASNYGK